MTITIDNNIENTTSDDENRIGGENCDFLPEISQMIRNSELVLKDDVGNSVDFSSSGYCEGVVNPACSAINIENSSDVIIGPVTQFNGPVTIYPNQNGSPALDLNEVKKLPSTANGDAKLVKSESTASDSPQNNSPTNYLVKKFRGTSTKFKCFVVTLFVSIVIAVLIAVIFLTRNPHDRDRPRHSDDDWDEPGEDPFDAPDLKVPLGKHYLITRKGWEAARPKAVVPAQSPVSFIIISHTVTPVCTTFIDCSTRIRNIQSYMMRTSNLNDIGYNFLIAGDGNVYEGRGWDVRNMHSANSLSISFIGNYEETELSESMIENAKFLIDTGVELKKVSKDYHLIGHNQTFNTLSPGQNVFKIIKTWPHFDSRDYYNLSRK